tara:strand:+ start:16729 stop:16926 length:198 start_codon:yes stop_codon:yes gene_type:complete
VKDKLPKTVLKVKPKKRETLYELLKRKAVGLFEEDQRKLKEHLEKNLSRKASRNASSRKILKISR